MTTHPPPAGQTVFGPQTNIAGDVNTGGGLFNAGMLTQYNFLAAGTPTRAPVALEVALARLAELPTDHVPPVAALPAGSWLPLPVNPHFVGRQPELLALAAALKGGGAAGITPGSATAATGLGGIGKTQLAAAFAHHYGHYFLGGVYWLSFADPAAVSAEVAQFAAWMSDLPVGVTHLPFPDQIKLVRRAWHESLPRLLIFDNCEDPALLEAWRPKSGGCRILLTSRHARWNSSQAVTTIAVGVLPRDESIALLRKFTPAQSTNHGDNTPSPSQGEGWGGGLADTELVEVLDAIAAELGDLPLALHLAGSYLATVAYDLPPAAYLAALRRPGLLDHPSLTGADYSPTGHDLHVARTFALSYGRLDDANATDATARHLLACAACFAPGEAIPRALLRAAAALGEEEAADRAAGALSRLVNLGLLEEVTGGALRLHRLLQHFVASALAATLPAAQSAVETTVLDQANQINNAGDPRPLLAWQPQLRHITDRTHGRRDEMAARLCNTLGFHLEMIGDYAGTRPYYERALAIHEQVLGRSHPDTALSLNNLGALWQATGDYAGARPYFERALAIRQQVLGADHPDTALSLNNLGALLRATGDYAGARPYYERTLAIRQQVLGADHPVTAQSLNSLGYLLRATGDYAGARPYYERALTIRQQVLGPDHPDTATSLNNLGALLDTMGDYAGARPYYERALSIRQQVLGADHPDTATSLNNLGVLAAYEGDKAAAVAYLQQALAICELRLGANHPDTLGTRASLAIVHAEVEASAPAIVAPPTLTDRLRAASQRLWRR
ncbi:MAG: tetratricopeptide repeat protein [Caldilineaceae bacterium]